MENIKTTTSKIGSILGGEVLIVERKPIDTKYSEDIKNGILTLSQQLYSYTIRRVTITDASLVTETLDNQPIYVKLNNDPNLRVYPAEITDLQQVFPTPNETTVKKAIEDFDSTGIYTLFTDYETLFRIISSLNNFNIQVLVRHIEKVNALIQTYKTINTLEEAKLKESTGNDNGNTTIIVRKEVVLNS